MLANLGFPLSFNFVGEFLIFLSFYSSNSLSIFTVIFCCFGFLLNVVYCIWTFNRICFGQLNWALYIKESMYDLMLPEVIILTGLIVPTFFLGIQPNLLLEYGDSHVYMWK